MEILSAIELKKYIYRKQIEIIYSKIIEAAKNFRNELYFNCDFKLEEKAINYFKKLGYKIIINYCTSSSPYKYMYEITW